jgi:hypothetical protein
MVIKIKVWYYVRKCYYWLKYKLKRKSEEDIMWEEYTEWIS